VTHAHPRHTARTTPTSSRPPAVHRGQRDRAATPADPRATGCGTHFVHLPGAYRLPLISAAEADGLPLTVETCPHSLTLRAEDVPGGPTPQPKFCPPIRHDANRELLCAAVLDGTIETSYSRRRTSTGPSGSCGETRGPRASRPPGRGRRSRQPAHAPDPRRRRHGRPAVEGVANYPHSVSCSRPRPASASRTNSTTCHAMRPALAGLHSSGGILGVPLRVIGVASVLGTVDVSRGQFATGCPAAPIRRSGPAPPWPDHLRRGSTPILVPLQSAWHQLAPDSPRAASSSAAGRVVPRRRKPDRRTPG
jgi:hypothetical protein